MIDAKSRVKENARHISRTTVSKAIPALAYVLFVTLHFSLKAQSPLQVGREQHLDCNMYSTEV